MSIPQSEFPLYLRLPEWRDVEDTPIAKTVETTAAVLVDIDVHGRVIGVELLGEVPTTTEWGVRWTDGMWEPAGGEDHARDTREHHANFKAIGKRQVTEWVEVDEKETGNG